MSKHQKGGQPESAPMPIEDWLTTFKIEVTSSAPALYANGYQQVELTLYVEAYENDDGDDLTEDEYNSLCLYTKNSNGLYERVPFTGDSEGLWLQATQKNPLFDYYDPTNKGVLSETAGSTAQPPDNHAERYKRVFLTSTAPGGTTEKIYAGITYRDGTLYYSGDMAAESSVTITAHHPRTFTAPTSFSFTYEAPGGGPPERYFINYMLRPRDENAEFSLGGWDQKGLIKWAENEASNTRATLVGFATAGQRGIVHPTNMLRNLPQVFLNDLRRELPSLIPGALTLCMQGDNRINFHPQTEIEFRGPIEVYGIDRQGHKYTTRVAYEAGSRDRLTIGNTNEIVHAQPAKSEK